MIAPSKLYQRLGQCTKKRWYRCWYLHSKPPTNFGRRNSEVFQNPNQQISTDTFQPCFPTLSESFVETTVRMEPFWSFPSTSPVLFVALAAAVSVLIFVVPRPHPTRRRSRRGSPGCRWKHRGDASASSPSSDQGLGWLGHFLKKNRGKPRKTISPSPKFP